MHLQKNTNNFLALGLAYDHAIERLNACAFLLLLLDLLPFTSSYGPYVLLAVPHVLGVYFTALPQAAVASLGVRIVNMIYGPSRWPRWEVWPQHWPGDTPHFTPTMPSQALCRQYSRHSQSLFFFFLLSLCISFSLKHTHTLPKELQKNRE